MDLKEIKNEAIGATEILKRTSGIMVRQFGGFGERTEVNLNGLQGNAVPVYYDGIPLAIFGGGIQLNNIPVDALNHIDVYKGVVPIEIATDALGGVINLITRNFEEDNLSGSYSIGSFNTHILTMTGAKKISDNLMVSAISFANYSDNNYLMRDIEASFSRILEDGTRLTENRIYRCKTSQ